MIPNDPRQVEPRTLTGFVLSGLHGAITLVERTSNTGCPFGAQSVRELDAAIARLEILRDAAQSGVRLGAFAGADPRKVELAYTGRYDPSNREDDEHISLDKLQRVAAKRGYALRPVTV